MSKNLPVPRVLFASLCSVTLFVAVATIPVSAGAASPTISGCPIFPSDNIWNTQIDTLPVDANSAAYITTIGPTVGVHPDFGSGLWDGAPMGIPYNVVPGTQPKVPISFDYPDESDPGPYPIPPNPQIEGGSQSTGDRHVLVLDSDNGSLYETWSTYPNADGSWHAGSGAIFNLKSNALRPSGWTSSDAAGLPILPGLLRYDEVASGEITHALRFTVPKTRMAYLWPARHYASSLTATNYPPMGQRFRLKASFDISGFSAQTQVILRALQKYGMFLADNGSAWYISGAPDSRWNNDVLVSELKKVTGSAFEAVDESSLMVNPDSGQARTTPSNNLPPTADAGPDQTVTMGTVVTLNGSNSTDTDDGIATYLWTQTAGPQIVFSNPNAVAPTFAAPNVGMGGAALTFSLKVTDKGGLTSTAACTVNVTWVNTPPTANAGPDQTVRTGATVTLNGSSSTDPDDGIASYRWTQTGGVAITLQNANTATPTFVAPPVSQGSQTLTFQLTVTDHGGLQSSDSCIVNVSAANAPPIANAGSDQTVYVGQTVKLDGSKSSDTDDGIASYRWTQTSGPPVTLSSPTAVSPTFKAPAVTQDGTALGFLLTVTDKGGLSATSRCTVTVRIKTPDLTGKWTSFGYSGNKVSGTFQLQNIGTAAAGQFTTSFYLSTDGINPGQLLKSYSTRSLSAGHNANISFSYSPTASLSGKYILGVVDSGNNVTESSKSNNKISQKVP